MKRRIVLTIALALVCFCAAQVSAKDISLETLLHEMTNRAAIAEFPDPYYTCKQASSYDRASVAPDQPGWFANGDASQFVRDEISKTSGGDRKEWVLMDEAGPGAIVRWWITAPHYKVTFRIYIDGATQPEIEANIGDLVGGGFLVGDPMSAEKARGRNLYLPIPYSKHIKVTVDDMPTQQNLYYQINYRTYEPGTNVESFTMAGFKKLADLVKKTQEELVPRQDYVDSMRRITTVMPLQPGSTMNIYMWKEKDIAIDGILMKFEADDVDDLAQALRSTLIRISFDDKETVCCPVGDFFGSGVSVNPYHSWYTSVNKDGWMFSRWLMPFQSSAKIQLENTSAKEVKFRYATSETPYEWTPNTMYFHCNWRQERDIITKAGDGTVDWNYIAVKGKGVFAGDSLSLVNRHHGWWGEGDEKIYVDGETFPSHFGTGTEDYYGYAWCTPEFFESPFHAQPRAEGPANYGNTTNSRYRLLDGIPFTQDFRFDMEVWHWIATKIDYAAATYWYAFDGATTNQPDNLVEEAKAKVAYKTTEYYVELPGYDLVNQPNGQLSIQDMNQWRGSKWHENKQLWWTGARPNDELKIKIKVENSGRQKFVVGMTKAVDYGQVQFSIDGKDVGGIVDLFHEGVIHTGMVTIGTVDLQAGEHVLGVKITGKNPRSTNFMFGMDKFEFKPLD